MSLECAGASSCYVHRNDLISTKKVGGIKLMFSLLYFYNWKPVHRHAKMIHYGINLSPHLSTLPTS